MHTMMLPARNIAEMFQRIQLADIFTRIVYVALSELKPRTNKVQNADLAHWRRDTPVESCPR